MKQTGWCLIYGLGLWSVSFATFATSLPIATDTNSPPAQVSPALAEEDHLPIDALRLFAEVYERVRQHYVEPISDEQLFDNALHGLLAELDPYSEFLDAKSYDTILEFTDGEMARSGVVLKLTNDQWRVERVEPDSSAARAGILVGDVVVRIDGKTLRNLGQQDIDQLLMGAVGSTVRLQVSSQGQRSREVRVLRQIVDVQAVESERSSDGIGILKIHAFQSQTGAQIQAVLDPWMQQNNVRGLVIDLRDNPGGLLSSAVEVANYFLDQGLIVSTRGRGEPEQRYQALSQQRYAGLPVILLMNRYSASAAEVLAGALQDHQRALIVGQTSYGKGSVQKLWPIGQGRAIKLTVARYYTPKNRMIEGRGIQPDIRLPLPDPTAQHDVVLQQAMDILRQRLMPATTVSQVTTTAPSTPPSDLQKK
jgi:carboxyl-terminal processing protease